MQSSTKKIIAGLMSFAMVLTLVVGVAGSANAQAVMASTYTRDLTVGSTGTDVTALQAMLSAGGYLQVAPTGYFGSLTKAALASWQAAVGISPAAGYFGPITRAYIASMGAGTMAPGCTAGSMFSSTTGQPCTTTTTTVPGCVAGAMFSSTTGQSCATGTTSGGTVGGTLDNTDGSITVSSSPFVSSGQQLKKGDTKDMVAVRVQATSGKVAVNRFDVHFNVRPWLFFSQVTLKDSSGNILATKTLSSASDATEISVGADYLVRFDSINYVVTPGSDATLVVGGTVLSSTDKLTQNTTVTVSIPQGAIRSLNGKGYTDSSQPSTGITNNVTLLSTGSIGDILTEVSANSPTQGIINTSTSGVTSNVVLGVFSLKSQNQSSTINSLNFTIGSSDRSSGVATSTDFSNVRLVVGGQTYGANSLSAGASTFTNLSIPLPQDTWTDLTLEADVAQNVSGITASSSLIASGINGVDANYNTVTLGNAATVTGSDQTFSTAAAALTSSSGTYTLSGGNNGSKSANVNFTFTLKNTGNQYIYISKVPGIALGTSTVGSVGTPVTASSTLTYVTANPSEGAVGDNDSSSAPASGYFAIPAGQSRTFTYSGTVDNTNNTNSGLRVFKITKINYSTTTTNLTSSNINFGLGNLVVTPSLVTS